MFDAVVLTLGFEPGPLITAVASAVAEGLSEGARIVVFAAGFQDERSERAWLQLQQVVGLMELGRKWGVRLEKYEVPLDDMVSAVLFVKRVLDGLREGFVKVSVTGGMRALGLALFIAYLFVDWVKEPRVEVYLEGRGAALELPRLHRVLSVGLSDVQVEIVKSMKVGEVYSSSDLAGLLKRDRSTIFRHLRVLVEKGLVEKTLEGYKLSELGKLLL